MDKAKLILSPVYVPVVSGRFALGRQLYLSLQYLLLGTKFVGLSISCCGTRGCGGSVVSHRPTSPEDTGAGIFLNFLFYKVRV